MRLRAMLDEEIPDCATMWMMELMSSQHLDKASALDALYARVTQMAGDMEGAARRLLAPVAFLNTTVATPCYEHTPALHIDMPNDLRVEFSPSSPLSTPYILNVNVRRTHQGFAKSSSAINFIEGSWLVGQIPLSDDQIRAWLTLDGPPPARW
jgi:hypothetical protein